VLRWGYGTKYDTRRDSSGLVAIVPASSWCAGAV
jgi:hypothetical protein